MKAIDLKQAFTQVEGFWQPKIAGAINDSYVKLARLKGEFIWHAHEHEDELFLVVRGTLTMRLRTKDVVVPEGALIIIPHGVEHCPVAEEEVHVLLLEPKSTVNTGSVRNDRTVEAGWLPDLEEHG